MKPEWFGFIAAIIYILIAKFSGWTMPWYVGGLIFYLATVHIMLVRIAKKVGAKT